MPEAFTVEYVKVPVRMLSWSLRSRDGREALGPSGRIVGRATKTSVGSVPIGNRGGTDVSPICLYRRTFRSTFKVFQARWRRNLRCGLDARCRNLPLGLDRKLAAILCDRDAVCGVSAAIAIAGAVRAAKEFPPIAITQVWFCPPAVRVRT